MAPSHGSKTWRAVPGTKQRGSTMKRTTSKKLLLGTVALMAGVGLASAQGMREGTSGTAGAGAEQHGTSSASPAAKSQGGAEIKSKGSAETRGQATGATEQKAQAPQRAQPDKNRMSGQTKPERSTTGQGSSDKDELKASGKENLKTKSSGKEDLKARSSEKENLKAKGQGSAKTNERSTTGQGTSEKTDLKGAADSKTQTPNATGQSQTSGSATQNATQQQSGAAVRSQAGKQITAQQQTSIQQSVLSARNAPRVDHVNFAVHTGAVVPRSVNVVAISTFPILIETFPQYRDYSFFVVEDEIVFVDRGHKIVDVVPAGPRARFSRSSSPSAVAVNLSEPEIREVQQVLVSRGFLHGRVTGVWGPETRDALIAFQRKEGFTANGTIDTRTVSALGLSGKVKAQESSSTQGSSSPTTGQGGSNGQNAPAHNQSTTGQNPSGGHNQPSDKQSSSPSQSTTGQGSSSHPSTGNSTNSDSMNSGSSSSTPGHSGSSSSTSGSSGQGSMPSSEKNKQ